MLTLAGYCGLRCCEISAVEWGHVLDSPDGPLLAVPEGKGGHSRLVPLHREVASALAVMPGVRRGHVLARKDGLPGPVRPPRVSKEINDHLHGLGIIGTAHRFRLRYLTETSCIEMIALVTDRYTDRHKLVALTLSAKGVDLDTYVTERRQAGDSWVQLSERLRVEFDIAVPQGTLHRWFRESETVAA